MWHVVTLVLFEVMAVGGLHVIGTRSYVRVDWFHISRWLAATPVDQVVISLAWLVALALAWWTLGSTLLYLLTRIRGFRAGARIAERLAPSVVRQVIDRAVATTLVTSVLLGTASPALADEQPPPPVTQQAPATAQYEPEPAGSEDAESERPGRGAGPGQAPRPVEQPPREEQPTADDQSAGSGSQPDIAPGPGEDAAAAELEADADRAQGDDAPARASEAASEDEQREPERTTERNNGGRNNEDDRGADNRGRRRSTPQAGERYTVRAGDHLWKIAVAVVSAEGDGKGDRNAIASYWAELVRDATPHLQSGDPNLIYPGEELELPPLRHRMGDRK